MGSGDYTSSAGGKQRVKFERKGRWRGHSYPRRGEFTTEDTEPRRKQQEKTCGGQKAYNAAMRCRLAQLVLLVACILIGLGAINAQDSATRLPERICSPSQDLDDNPSSRIAIEEVSFLGAYQLPVLEQQQIAASIKHGTHRDSLQGVIDEALDRAKAGWQDRGYFQVKVSTDSKTVIRTAENRIYLTIQVEEGLRYRLGRITFKNNKAISDVSILRGLFPIQDGEILSREKVAKGLHNLMEAYGESGYINFTSVPHTTTNDNERTLSLVIDIDEGKQFYIASIEVLGVNRNVLDDLALKPGQILNMRVIEQWLLRHVPESWATDPNVQEMSTNARTGAVALRFDFRPCTTR